MRFATEIEAQQAIIELYLYHQKNGRAHKHRNAHQSNQKDLKWRCTET